MTIKRSRSPSDRIPKNRKGYHENYKFDTRGLQRTVPTVIFSSRHQRGIGVTKRSLERIDNNSKRVTSSSDMSAPLVTSMTPGNGESSGIIEKIPVDPEKRKEFFKFNNTVQLNFSSTNGQPTYTPATYTAGALTTYGTYTSTWRLLPTGNINNWVTPLQMQRMMNAGVRRMRCSKLACRVSGLFFIQTQATGQTTTLSNDRPRFWVYRDKENVWPMSDNNTIAFNMNNYEDNEGNVLPIYDFNHVSTSSADDFRGYLPDQVRNGGIELMSEGDEYYYEWINPSDQMFDMLTPLSTSSTDTVATNFLQAFSFSQSPLDWTFIRGVNSSAANYSGLQKIQGIRRENHFVDQIMFRFPQYFGDAAALNYKVYMLCDYMSEWEVEYRSFGYSVFATDPNTGFPVETRDATNNTGRFDVQRGRRGFETFPVNPTSTESTFAQQF